MSQAPKGFEPMYTKVYPVRKAQIALERVHQSHVPGIRAELTSYRAVVSDAGSGDRIFSLERWGARTAILEASQRAARMGLELTVAEDRTK